MFVVVYRFRVREGSEELFQQAWEKRTHEIAERNGGLGSRLHRTEDGAFIAYAQWPSREVWQEAGKDTADTDARRAVADTLVGAEVVFEMDVIQDLLLGRAE
jgi:heme-degrading monooxygenase HmoA